MFEIPCNTSKFCNASVSTLYWLCIFIWICSVRIMFFAKSGFMVLALCPSPFWPSRRPPNNTAARFHLLTRSMYVCIYDCGCV